MGSADRILRIVLAAIIAFLFFSGVITGFVGILLLIFSIVFVLTSIVSFCPLYTLFGFKTCKVIED